MESKVVVPAKGAKITIDAKGKLIVPDNPVIPFIEGDGIGADVTPVMIKVVDAAVKKPTAVSVKSPGWKSTPVRNPQNCMAVMSGCRMKPSILSVTTAWLSKAL